MLLDVREAEGATVLVAYGLDPLLSFGLRFGLRFCQSEPPETSVLSDRLAAMTSLAHGTEVAV